VDRVERLLNLAAALLDTPRPLTAAELREAVPGYPPEDGPTFQRAFERDKATLRDMGIPIETQVLDASNPESPPGYRVRPERYELPDPGLEPDEVAALYVAATQVRLQGGNVTAAIWKLGGVPSPVVPTGVVTIPGEHHLPMLFAAAAERRTLGFTYRGEARTVDPWRLEFRNGAWYVIGWDHSRGERRTFRLDRIEGEPVAGAPGAFAAPAAAAPTATRPWEMGDEEPVDVRVRVDADQADWAVAQAGPGEVGPGGCVELTLRVTSRAGLRSWVLGFLDHAEIVSPPAERDALISWLERCTELYGSPRR
jgi:proteasome accessory factor B